MNSNILGNNNTSKIILSYTEHGISKKLDLMLKFMDNKECYFSMTNNHDFIPPKNKTKAQLIVYTSDGIFVSNVSILSTEIYQNEIQLNVSIPKKYDYIQCRASSRIIHELPISIKFNDGFEIGSMTYDLSLGGVTFMYDNEMPSIYKRLTGVLNIQFPPDLVQSFSDGKLVTESKYIRTTKIEDLNSTKKLLAFKFVGMKNKDKETLKNYLIGIN